MKIQFLTINNLKSYKSASILLSENINLLVGPNNSGKSTIIKALLNLQYNSFDQKDIRSGEFCAEIFTSITDITEEEYYKYYYTEDMYSDFTLSSGITTISKFNQKGIEQFEYTDSSNVGLKQKKLNGLSKENNISIKLIKFNRFSASENKNSFIYPFLAKRKTDYYDSNITQDNTFKISDSLKI
jgi:predicted ATP-dependent endonuclease of OLD family